MLSQQHIATCVTPCDPLYPYIKPSGQQALNIRDPRRPLIPSLHRLVPKRLHHQFPFSSLNIEHSLLNGVPHHESEDSDFSCLAEAVDTIDCLVLLSF